MNTTIRSELVDAISFEKFASFLDDVKEDVSIFGARYIYLEACQGTLHLHALPLHMMSLASKKNGTMLDQKERAALDVALQKVDALISQNDAKIINRFTYFLRSIRDFWDCFVYTPVSDFDVRYYWSHHIIMHIMSSPKKNMFPGHLKQQVIRKEIQSLLATTLVFTDLLTITQQAEVNISLLGSRFVYFDDYEGTLPFSALTQRVFEIAKKTPGFRQDHEYQEIVQNIDALFSENDKRKSERNVLTRMICTVRDIWSSYILRDNTRLEWDAHKAGG